MKWTVLGICFVRSLKGIAPPWNEVVLSAITFWLIGVNYEAPLPSSIPGVRSLLLAVSLLNEFAHEGQFFLVGTDFPTMRLHFFQEGHPWIRLP